MPRRQVAEALGSVHSTPHPPQWFTSAVVFRHVPEQFVSPPGHVCPHTPDTHTAPPPTAAAHDRRHIPQLLVSTRVSTSHPLFGSPSQSAKPGAHAKRHTPPEQLTVALARGAHALPHPPQLATEVRTSTSHPVVALPSQFPKPGAHANAHTPDAQEPTAFAGVGQTLPQRPQLAPVARLDSQPLRESPSQSPSPAEHTGIMQVPLWHVLRPPGSEHIRPHTPQWFASVCVSTSHPLEARPSQLSRPVVHVKPQEPSVHNGVEPGYVEQVRSHAPQFITSRLRSVHPLPQSVSPVAQTGVQAPAEHTSPGGHIRLQPPQ